MVPFWDRCTTRLVYFSGDWDVHWGYDLGFDPWPPKLALALHRLLGRTRQAKSAKPDEARKM